jgi:hypothetical protein
MAAVDLLEAAHEEGAAHEHLLADCPWYRRVAEERCCTDPDEHCSLTWPDHAPLKTGGALAKFTPRTPEASTVVKPTVPPGGPGLFHQKGMHLPPYMEHLWFHLVKRYGKHDAYRVANGIVHKWAKGINPGGWQTKSGKGKRVHPDVQAAASRNIAEWEADRAKAHAHTASEVKASASAVDLLLAVVGSAPGARMVTAGPGTAGQNGQFGLWQHPAATVSPSPPMPPNAKLPTAAEVQAVVRIVPPSADVTLSNTVRKFLDQAAGKLNRDSPVEALAALRGAQTALFAAYKADIASRGPVAYTANVFVPPAEQSSGSAAALKTNLDQAAAYRKLEVRVAELADRIRRAYFNGIQALPSQPLRLTG